MTPSLLQKPLMVFSTGKKNEQDKLESTVSNLHPMRLLWPLTLIPGHQSLPVRCCTHSATMTNTPPNTLIRPNNVIVLYSPFGNGDNEWLHKQEGLLIADAGVASNWKRPRVQILIDWKHWLEGKWPKTIPKSFLLWYFPAKFKGGAPFDFLFL